VFEWVTGMIEGAGYGGIALLMFIENVFPPIPSEVIMPLAGFVAARGDLNLVLVIVAGALGSLAGALMWYYVGVWVGLDRVRRFAARYGRWLTMTPEEVDQADAWFDRHNRTAVLVGRLVPAVRTLISVPAGVSGMAMPTFLLCSGIGTLLWTGFLAGAGYWLGDQHEAVARYMNPVSNLVIGLLAAGYLYRVATFRKRSPIARQEKASRSAARDRH
jgi:membrane protein DedA with SNARE-associated domain